MKRRRALEYLLLALAIVPLALLAGGALVIWLNGETDRVNWHGTAWPLVAAQVIALVAYMVHASRNKNLDELQLSAALWELLFFQNVAMLNYWFKHVWHEHLGPHR